MTTPLNLFNSLTRQVEQFRPVHPGEARVYSCGPTVYNYPHIGNMRAYVFADLLGRTLSWKGYALTHIINITDVGHLTDDGDAGEDKLEKAASASAQSIWDIAQHYTEAYWADVKALNIRQPAEWTIATKFVPQMIEFAERIADKHCYELEGGLYFDTSTVADYGSLAGRTKLDQVREDEESFMRIDPVKDKRNAADFAIWRKTPPGESRQMEWDSPWGRGAPGWHLECSVMSAALLGLPFDIHTGGIDHREIHHPNEIAQNQAFCGSDHSGAKLWMHNNFLVERSGKMSKSSGEFLRLQLLIDKGYAPVAYRLMCLQAHYRSELEFSWDGLEAALTRLKRMLMGVAQLRSQLEDLPAEPEGGWTLDEARGHVGGALLPLLAEFDKAISDDLNSPLALTVFEDVLAAKKIEREHKWQMLAAMDAVLGLGVLALDRKDLRLRPRSATITEAEIEAALARRKEARGAKDFATSDALRDQLAEQGVEVMDGDALGWDWKLG